NVKQLQNELGGIRLSIESFDDMPDDLEQPNRFWQDNRKNGRSGGRDNRKNKGKGGRKKSYR
ncbi:MAG: hypothetical protein ACPGMW_02680, partial [Poseidonia sp.]